MALATCIRDFREIARRRIPRAIFDYADGGSYAELTIDANRRDLDALRLKPRVMVDVSERRLGTTMVGEPVSLPLAIAPTGLAGLFHRDGEICGARAAQAAGIPFCLSTVSICSIEDVRAAVEKPFWFQLYVMRDRGFTNALIERAKSAQCSALVVTLDLQIQGQRHKDIRNGLSVPPRLTLGNALDIASKPSWALGLALSRRRTFGNLVDSRAPDGITTLSRRILSQFDPTMNWSDIEAFRALWPGKLILKGVMGAEDARIAAAVGADALVVSNHGGRQLDSAPSSISALREVVEAVGDKTEVLFDGGVQSGQDVLKALALGAKGCLMGKGYLYALAAAGQAGVARAIEIIRDEMSVSMALMGLTDVAAVDRSVLL